MAEVGNINRVNKHCGTGASHKRLVYELFDKSSDSKLQVSLTFLSDKVPNSNELEKSTWIETQINQLKTPSLNISN